MLIVQQIYTKYTIEKALANIIAKKPEIEKVYVKTDLGKIKVYVRFKDIENFMQVYDNLYETINYNLKGKPFSIEINNPPDKFLEEVYDQHIQFVVYEAVQTGNYTEMKKQLDDISSSKKIFIKAYINNKNVYLKLTHEDNYFYCIIKKSN